mmetsp:Transcript_17888/g.52191  ORF Transcript_17888/g.52191 Transcript_17888/m.52191 type:complete len:241 (-) Transcript_17888:193-915(-)
MSAAAAGASARKRRTCVLKPSNRFTGNFAPARSSQRRNSLIQQRVLWTLSSPGRSAHIWYIARCAQGLSGSKLGSKAHEGPPSRKRLRSGGSRPKTTVTSVPLAATAPAAAGSRGPTARLRTRTVPAPLGGRQLRWPQWQTATAAHAVSLGTGPTRRRGISSSGSTSVCPDSQCSRTREGSARPVPGTSGSSPASDGHSLWANSSSSPSRSSSARDPAASPERRAERCRPLQPAPGPAVL